MSVFRKPLYWRSERYCPRCREFEGISTGVHGGKTSYVCLECGHWWMDYR